MIGWSINALVDSLIRTTCVYGYANVPKPAVPCDAPHANPSTPPDRQPAFRRSSPAHPPPNERRWHQSDVAEPPVRGHWNGRLSGYDVWLTSLNVMPV